MSKKERYQLPSPTTNKDIYLHIFWGKISEGNKRGRVLGYPTANMKLHKDIPEGIYISNVSIDNKRYPSVTFVGKAKTFHENIYQAETYILDFNQDIYNKWMSVYLIKKIRGNQQFKTTKDLLIAIEKDVIITRTYFNI